MPAMPRPAGKARKIAYSILGKPENIAFKASDEQRKLTRLLRYQNTTRIK